MGPALLKIRLRSEISDPSLEGFLYFFQVLNEQLYNFTDPSYKAPALNTFTRTLELQSIARSNHQAGIGKEALIAFVEELEWSIDHDPLLSVLQKALCKTHMKAVREGLAEPDRISKSLAGLRISLGDYFSGIVSQIKILIDDKPNRKEDLARLASAFVVQAEFAGYPRRHTYHVLKDVIYRRVHNKSTIDVKSILDEFFDRFKSDGEYQCVMVVGEAIRSFPKMIERFGIEIVGDLYPTVGLNARQIDFVNHKSAGQIFVKISKIKTTCAVKAHQTAVARFNALVAEVTYIQHRVELERSKLALIERSDGSKFIVRDDLDPMHGWSSSHRAGEEEMLWLDEAINADHFTPESSYRVARAVKYHAAALQTESYENKLVDLWAGLEGLLAKPRRGTPKIDFFAESILPSLTLTYPEKLLRSLFASVAQQEDITEIVNRDISSAKSDFGKFVHFMLCVEYGPSRDEASAILKGWNPLLLNRCAVVAKKLENRKAVLTTIKQHRVKVKWHIERIYSMRNSIMHSASALPHLATLVENLHNYIDSLIFSLARTAVSAREPVSIEGALQYLSAWERHRIQSLSERNASFERQVDVGSVWDVVFGADLALSPAA